MAADHFRVKRSDQGDAARGIREGQGMFSEACCGVERRRSTALMEPGYAEHDCQPGSNDINGNAADHLITPVCDAGEAVQESQSDGNRKSRAKSSPCRARDSSG